MSYTPLTANEVLAGIEDVARDLVENETEYTDLFTSSVIGRLTDAVTIRKLRGTFNLVADIVHRARGYGYTDPAMPFVFNDLDERITAVPGTPASVFAMTYENISQFEGRSAATITVMTVDEDADISGAIDPRDVRSLVVYPLYRDVETWMAQNRPPESREEWLRAADSLAEMALPSFGGLPSPRPDVVTAGKMIAQGKEPCDPLLCYRRMHISQSAAIDADSYLKDTIGMPSTHTAELFYAVDWSRLDLEIFFKSIESAAKAIAGPDAAPCPGA